MLKNKRWDSKGRQVQANRMSKNMRGRWDEVQRNPVRRAAESRIRSLYAQSGQALAVWMTNPNVALTQEALGKLIGVSGMTVSNWVSGRSKPRQKSINRLAALAKEYPVELDLSWTE